LALACYRNHYDEVNGQRSIVFPGVVEGLRRMVEAGLQLACLTNKSTAFARPLLESKGLARYFVLAFGADAFPRRKPDPMPLVRICKALGTEPGRTLVIGDSTHDARAARAAGCPVALVNYGYNHGRPVEDDRPDAVVSRLDELFAPAVAKA
jgi:phosphoglycolate phosphatase